MRLRQGHVSLSLERTDCGGLQSSSRSPRDSHAEVDFFSRPLFGTPTAGSDEDQTRARDEGCQNTLHLQHELVRPRLPPQHGDPRFRLRCDRPTDGPSRPNTPSNRYRRSPILLESSRTSVGRLTRLRARLLVRRNGRLPHRHGDSLKPRFPTPVTLHRARTRAGLIPSHLSGTGRSLIPFRPRKLRPVKSACLRWLLRLTQIPSSLPQRTLTSLFTPTFDGPPFRSRFPQSRMQPTSRILCEGSHPPPPAPITQTEPSLPSTPSDKEP